MNEKTTPAERIVNELIDLLEKGVSPWHKPWTCAGVPQGIDGRPYRGINALLLGMLPYRQPKYLTFNKCKALGGNVRKGEKGHFVVYWDHITKKEVLDDGTEELRSFYLIRGYVVFNVEQCDGLPEKFFEKVDDSARAPRIDDAEAIWDGYADRPQLVHRNLSAAFYSPASDEINIPERGQFGCPEEYYSTLFHEAAHSTGSPNRLSRLKWDGFGSESYSHEELVAEIASQILCQRVGITRTLPNAAAYCKSWAARLKGECARNIVSACTAAQKAADYILGTKSEE